jgi:hypothetical protein
MPINVQCKYDEGTHACLLCGRQYGAVVAARNCVANVPLLTKVANFAAAAVQHVAAGAPRCTDEQIAARHDICLGCEHYQGGACTQCGCPVSREKNLISKLAWADQSCPVGKWGTVS